MFGRKEERFPKSKVLINPSYEWDGDAKDLNISYRELEVFALLMDGHDNKEIAQLLGIQYQSVKNHISSLYRKLKARNMAEAVKLLLFGNFIKVEMHGTDWKYDRERWIENVKWQLEDSNYQLSKSEKKEIKKFLLEHGLLGKVYKERLEELQEDEKP